MWFMRYARGQADRQTYRRTDLNTSQPPRPPGREVTSTSVFGNGRISTHADSTRGPCARPRHGCPGSSHLPGVNSITPYARWAAMARATLTTHPILGFWGSFWACEVPQNERFPALDADESSCKI